MSGYPRPTPAQVRAWEPWPGESVVIRSFWAHLHGRPIVFHRRYDPGTACDPDRYDPAQYLCGHALPLFVAEKIARPCRRCFP